MKVAVTGSGESILGLGLGREIDDCDAVVRVNWQPLYGFECDMGSVNHYWVTDLRPANHAKPDGYDTIRKVWVFPPFDFSPETAQGRKQICPDKELAPVTQREYDKLYNMIPGRKWPSNGLGAVALALWRLQPDEMLLLGFDCVLRPDRETYRYYWGEEFSGWRSNNHDYHAERDICLALLNMQGFQTTWSYAGNRRIRRCRLWYLATTAGVS